MKGGLPISAVGGCHDPSVGDYAGSTDVASVVLQRSLVRVLINFYIPTSDYSTVD